MPERLLTTKEAADLLNLSVASLTRYRHAGEGPDYVRIGNRAVRYRQEDLEGFINEGLRKPRGPEGTEANLITVT